MVSLFPLTLTEGLVRRRGQVIMGPVSLTVEGRGLTVLMGPNGAGKSTLLKALHGIERLSAGRLRHGCPSDQSHAAQAFVFQTPVVLRRSVAANLAYPLKLHGVGRAERARLIEDWSARIRLSDRLDQPAARLSGGERQKLATARALIRSPQLLFLDEPTANLDGRSTREIEDLLRAARDGGTRIVMATHDFAQARRLADDAWFMMNGRIVETGPSPQFFDTPARSETRAFLRGDILE
ncbi:tungstate transport system ATP-binding protein [Palleronia salina]|uniref:Tungstate transport system ATP-binding protein n=1 Tax=Palleronia salina TaxID=313368 RepID=A0A1M6JMW3_9RHOB|nr:ATP-binding cassette domain-containing protein [Palleronia salina]SHJ47954.1 tungstate transport system ATP-binding protein [Palleronia salina]